MKKIMFCLLVIMNQSYAGSSLLFNLSRTNDMLITYQICYEKEHFKYVRCDAATSIRIEAKTDSNKLNYYRLPSIRASNDGLRPVALILSAVEFDESGNMISKGEFGTKNYPAERMYSSCRGSVLIYENKDFPSNSGILALDDMNGSEYITCSYRESVLDEK